MDRYDRTVVWVFGYVPVELRRHLREGLHDHVLRRSLSRLFSVGLANGVRGRAEGIGGIALAALLVLDGHRLDGRADDATLLGYNAAGCAPAVVPRPFPSCLLRFFCRLWLALLGLGEAHHVSVGKMEVAPEGDLVGVHIVRAVVEAQTRKSCEALICRRRQDLLHGWELGQIHGHAAAHVGAVQLARLQKVGGGMERRHVGGEGVVHGGVVAADGRHGRRIAGRGFHVGNALFGSRREDGVGGIILGIHMVFVQFRRGYGHAAAAILERCVWLVNGIEADGPRVDGAL